MDIDRASTPQTQWIPPPGRHKVDVGSSLKRALRARKGMPATANKNMPVSDYYLLGYRFKPGTVDTSKPGVVEVKQSKDTTVVQVERPSLQSDEVHTFRGTEEPSKEVDCVLIYDEETNTFTLEKLDSQLHLSYEGRGPPKTRPPSASPLPNNTPSPAATSKALVNQGVEEEEEEDDDLDRVLLTALGGSDNKKKHHNTSARPAPPPATAPAPAAALDDLEQMLEEAIDHTKPTTTATIPKKSATGKTKMKAKEAPVFMPHATSQAPPQANTSTPNVAAAAGTVAPPRPKPRLKGSAKTAATTSAKPSAAAFSDMVAASTSSTPAPKGAAAANTSSSPGKKANAAASTPRVSTSKPPRPRPVVAPPPEPFPSGIEVEEFDFGQRARPALQVTPPSTSSAVSPTGGLALPFSDGAAAFMPGPPPGSSSSSASRSAPKPIAAIPIIVPDDDDDDEEEWEAVVGDTTTGSHNNFVAPPMALDASTFGGSRGAQEEGVQLDLDQFADVLGEELLAGLEEDDGDGDGDGDADDDMFGDQEYEEAAAAAASQSTSGVKGKPMSLNEFAKGVPVETTFDDQDDDDYSSSEEEESDED